MDHVCGIMFTIIIRQIDKINTWRNTESKEKMETKLLCHLYLLTYLCILFSIMITTSSLLFITNEPVGYKNHNNTSRMLSIMGRA